jgi:hypothetical protein
MVYATKHDQSETIALNRRRGQARPLLWLKHVPPPGVKEMRFVMRRDDQWRPKPIGLEGVWGPLGV